MYDSILLANEKMHTKQLSELYAKAVTEHIQIDWFSISAGDLKCHHTMNECIG